MMKKFAILVLLVLVMAGMTAGAVGASAAPAEVQGSALQDAEPGLADFFEVLTTATVANGVPVILVVLGLTQLTEKLGVKGRWQLLAAVMIGLIFGAGYQLTVAVPADVAGWFGVVIFGIAMGLAASGIYEVGMKMGLGDPYKAGLK
jgi:hypothetical protein